MARRCDLCNKKAVSGHNVSYSKRRTVRRFLPNLRFITLEGQRIKTCMKCLKKLKNEGKVTMKRAPQKIKTPEVIKETIKVKKTVKVKVKKVKTKKV